MSFFRGVGREWGHTEADKCWGRRRIGWELFSPPLSRSVSHARVFWLLQMNCQSWIKCCCVQTGGPGEGLWLTWLHMAVTEDMFDSLALGVSWKSSEALYTTKLNLHWLLFPSLWQAGACRIWQERNGRLLILRDPWRSRGKPYDHTSASDY